LFGPFEVGPRASAAGAPAIVLAFDGTAVDSVIAAQVAKKLDLEMGRHRY